MGRDLNQKVHCFLKFNPGENKSVCNVCGVKFTGNHSTNLKRHLNSKHQEIFNEFDKNEDAQKVSN